MKDYKIRYTIPGFTDDGTIVTDIAADDNSYQVDETRTGTLLEFGVVPINVIDNIWKSKTMAYVIDDRSLAVVEVDPVNIVVIKDEES